MRTTGSVSAWHDDEGWGVVEAPELAGGCWVHFSVVERPGLRRLRAGERVVLAYEAAQQDGYAYRALSARPVEAPGAAPPEPEPAGPAYRTALALTFDDPPQDPVDG
jgi:CspA family cold shock protein